MPDEACVWCVEGASTIKYFFFLSLSLNALRNQDVDVERGADASASGRQESRNYISSSYSSGREYGGDVSYSGRKNVPGGGSIGTLTSPSSTRWSNTYGLSPQFLDSLGIPGPLIDRIFVANVSSNQGKKISFFQGIDDIFFLSVESVGYEFIQLNFTNISDIFFNGLSSVTLAQKLSGISTSEQM